MTTEERNILRAQLAAQREAMMGAAIIQAVTAYSRMTERVEGAETLLQSLTDADEPSLHLEAVDELLKEAGL